MGARRARPVVLDAGALIAFERNDAKVRTLIELAMTHGRTLHVTAGVIAQVWRDGARQARLARLLGSGWLDVHALDLDEAQAVGVLCGRSGTHDVVDASVALLARRLRAVVVTSDADDLRRLDPQIELVSC
jgi:hypothetical protein